MPRNASLSDSRYNFFCLEVELFGDALHTQREAFFESYQITPNSDCKYFFSTDNYTVSNGNLLSANKYIGKCYYYPNLVWFEMDLYIEDDRPWNCLLCFADRFELLSKAAKPTIDALLFNLWCESNLRCAFLNDFQPLLPLLMYVGPLRTNVVSEWIKPSNFNRGIGLLRIQQLIRGEIAISFIPCPSWPLYN